MKKYVIYTVLLAAIIHFAAVFAMPHLIMYRVMSRFEVNKMIATPPVDENSRAIVKPSPDLIYSLCAYDVSKGDVRVTVAPYHSYWSAALYQANSDNYFISKDKGFTISRNERAGVVTSPSNKGIVLFRFLVQDKDDMVKALAAQKQINCEFSPQL